MPSQPLPNILLIQADQHRHDCLGVSGHPLLQTPHLDRLAAGGTRFTHAYTPIGVCIPARNSLIYGTWPHDHLSIANWGTEAPRPAREGLIPYTRLLNEAGYSLAHVGKWQIHPQQGPLAYGYHERIADKDYASWREARGCPPPPKPGWLGGLDADAHPEDTRLAWGAAHVVAQLEQAAARGCPFYLEWDIHEPHLPCIPPEPYHSLYDPAEIPPWPGFADPLDGKPYAQAQQRRTWQVDGWNWEDWAPVVARYLGTVTLLDAQVGRVLEALERLGLAEDTMVVYTTDHGDMCGSHGMVDKHMVMYDDVIRVPLIVRWPAGEVTQGTTCEAFVSHALDLAATFCEVAGISIPETFRGQSLLPLLAGDRSAAREDIFAAYHGNQFGLYSQRMVRDARFKYVWNATAEDELYDLEDDPGELVNRATDAAYATVLSEKRARLVEWMEETEDPLLNGWTRRQLLEGLSI